MHINSLEQLDLSNLVALIRRKSKGNCVATRRESGHHVSPLFASFAHGKSSSKNAPFKKDASIADLVLGIIRNRSPLREDDLVIEDVLGHHTVIDPDNNLDLHSLPTLYGTLIKRKARPKTTASRLFCWNQRFVVIHKCTLYWFHSKQDFFEREPGASYGTINLILHPCKIDVDNRHPSRFIVQPTDSDVKFVFDASGCEYDKGLWTACLLAHINMASATRRRFRTINWSLLKKEACLRQNYPRRENSRTSRFSSAIDLFFRRPSTIKNQRTFRDVSFWHSAK